MPLAILWILSVHTLHAQISPPTITQQPQATSAKYGHGGAMQVEADGQGLSFQWYRGQRGDTSNPVSGANGSILVTPRLTDTTTFWVRAFSSAGSVDSAAASVAVAPRQAGKLVAAGDGALGELGTASQLYTEEPLPVAENVVKVYSSRNHTLFIDANRTLWGMGSNNNGQLGLGHKRSIARPAKIAHGVVQAAAGGDHTLYIASDGSLWAMGDNNFGQLADGTREDSTIPVSVASDVSKVVAGENHTLFIKNNGELWGSGSDYYSQLAQYDLIATGPIRLLESVRDVAAGLNFSLYVTDAGVLYGMGHNTFSQLGVTTSTHVIRKEIAENVDRVAAGALHSLFLDADGTLHGLGNNETLQLGSGLPTIVPRPKVLAENVADFEAGGAATLFTNHSGELLGLGTFDHRKRQTSTLTAFHGRPLPTIETVVEPYASPTRIATDAIHYALGEEHALYVDSAGTLWAMGSRSHGQLGDGVNLSAPHPIEVGSEIVSVESRESHTFFIDASGTLWATGSNEFGQLGDGTFVDRSIPVAVASDVEEVSTGVRHSVFLKSDGTVWAMGRNSRGELGNELSGATTVTAPVQVATDVRDISAGGYHTMILKIDGTLWAAGSNADGELGVGSGENIATFQQVAAGVSQVSAGSHHSLFVKSDGTLWGMGASFTGQLGLPTENDEPLPQLLATEVLEAKASGYTSFFITTDRTLFGMGSNGNGQMGIGDDTSEQRSPVQIVSDVRSVAAGSYHTLVTKTDGSLWAMGMNDFGQLADGTTERQYLPVRVAEGVSAAAGGGYHSLFVATGDTPAQLLSHSDNQIIPVGASVTLEAEGWSLLGNVAYQWYSGQSGSTSRPVSGATQPTLLAGPLDADTSYWVRASNALGSQDSATIQIDVAAPPLIIRQPSGLAVEPGDTATLDVLAREELLFYQWYRGESGDTSRPIEGATQPTFETPPIYRPTPYWVRISGFFDHVDSDTTVVEAETIDLFGLWGFGHGNFAQPGEGGDWATKEHLLLYEGAVAADGGQRHTMLIDSRGGLWRLEDDGTFYGFGSASSVSVGHYHNVWITPGGDLYGHGESTTGALKNYVSDHYTSIDLEESDVVQAVAGTRCTLFLKSDGTLYGLGTPLYYRGLNTWVYDYEPYELATDVAYVANEGRHTLFIKNDGTLWGIGSNREGQLGASELASFTEAVHIDSDVAKAVAGEFHTAYIKTDGTLWTLGSGESGQLGRGFTTGPQPAAQIAENVADVESGYEHLVFLNDDGTMWTTGLNANGQLGDGTTENSGEPVQVATDVEGIAAGNHHTLYLKSIPPIIAEQPAFLWRDLNSADLAIGAYGGETTYQWYYGESGDTSQPIGEATTTAVLSLSGLAEAIRVWVRVANSYGHTDSESVFAKFYEQPAFTSVSDDYLVLPNTAVSLAATATGNYLSYQWYEGQSGDTSQPIANATDASFTTPGSTAPPTIGSGSPTPWTPSTAPR